MGECIDRVFSLRSDSGGQFTTCIMSGTWQEWYEFVNKHATTSAIGFIMHIDALINAKNITEPGVYIILRQDTTVDDDALFIPAYLCTIDQDMNILEGLAREGSSRLTTWPPKLKKA